MITVRSDSSQAFGAAPSKQGQNAIIVTYDGAAGVGNNIAYIDARTVYRNGNNMGAMFQYEGAGSCVVTGSSRPITANDSTAAKAAFPWSAVATLNTTDRDASDAPNIRQSLQLTFTGAGRVIITRA